MRVKVSFLDIAKLSVYGLFLNWYVIHIFRGGLIPRLSLILYVVAAGAFLLDVIFNRKGRVLLTKEEWIWILYAFFALATFMFAQNTGYVFDGMVEFVKRLFIIVLVTYVCDREESIGFPVRLMSVTAILCAVGVVTHLNGLQNRLDLTTNASVSINDVGSIMVFGLFTALLFFDRWKEKETLTLSLKTATLLLCVVVIFVSGSRKSIYAVIIMMALFLLWRANRFTRNVKPATLIAYAVVGAIAGYVVIRYLLPQMFDTSLYERLFGRRSERASSSDSGRLQLYINALKDFLDHPLFGLGFDNYRYVHYAYTHSTYVETLACNGVIGILYLVPYGMVLVKQIQLVKLSKGLTEEYIFQKKMLAFYVAFLFVGIGIPYVYKDAPGIMSAMFFASQKMSFCRIEKKEIAYVGKETDSGIADYC